MTCNVCRHPADLHELRGADEYCEECEDLCTPRGVEIDRGGYTITFGLRPGESLGGTQVGSVIHKRSEVVGVPPEPGPMRCFRCDQPAVCEMPGTVLAACREHAGDMMLQDMRDKALASSSPGFVEANPELFDALDRLTLGDRYTPPAEPERVDTRNAIDRIPVWVWFLVALVLGPLGIGLWAGIQQ